MKVRDIIKRIEDDGWVLVRTRGSHRHFHHPTKKGIVTVAGHSNTDLPIATLKRIYEQAQIKEK